MGLRPLAPPAWRRTLIALALLVLVPPLLCWPLLAGLRTADPEIWTSLLAFHQPGPDLLMRGYPGWADGNAGVTTEALGGLAASDWLHGTIPWWNPYSGIGLPLAAEQQNSALFLPFVLLLALPNGVLLLKLAVQIVAGGATFGLLRTLGLGRGIACAGGILAELNGTFAWYSHGPIMPVAFLPLLLWGIESCRRQARHGAPLVALAIAMSLLAGFPETAYLDGLLGAVWCASRLVAMRDRRTALRVAGRVGAGGVAGLLLASPAIVTFLGSLHLSYLSQHADFDALHLLRPNLLMLVLPYAYGPILYGFEMNAQGPEIWWHAGGFIGLPLAGAALTAVISALLRRDVAHRGLRGMLALWLLATGLKAVGWPPAVAVFDRIPFIRQSMFYVYILPSWEIASIVLAALCLQDARERRLPAAAIWGSGACLAGGLAVALRLAWPWLADLAGHARGLRNAAWIPCGIETALALLLLATLPLAARERVSCVARGPVSCAARERVSCVARGRVSCVARGRMSWPVAALLAASVIDFTFPLLSAARPRPLDLAPLQWLRSHLGNDRFYSADILQPNTAARFRVSSVNHIYLPVPQNWVDYLHHNLNPAMDGVTFFGDDLRVAQGSADLAGLLRPRVTIAQAVHTLENLSVRYVVVPHGLDPFADTVGPALDLATRAPMPLAGTRTVTAAIRADALAAQTVTALGIEVGTYRGQAAGTIVAELCAAARCAEARLPVAGLADNAVAWTTLDRPLSVGDAGTVAVAIHAEGPANRPALWVSPCANAACSTAPAVVLRFRSGAARAAPAYADRLVDIVPLPDPMPYVEASHCRLETSSRDDIAASCTAPDTLIRRELFTPGWQVRVGGHAQPIASAAGIFQSVTLPAGQSSVTFRYRPPGEMLMAGALVLGALILVSLVIV